MKVSVIIPCYNFEEYIEQAILSAVSQKTNFEFEILVRDDFSTDRSGLNIDRVSIFNSNVKVFKPEENLGAQKNIKFLIEQSKGQYIAYLDGDDYWTDVNKLQKQIDFLDNNPDYILTFTGYCSKNKDGKYTPGPPHQWFCLPNFENDEVKTENLLRANYVTFGRVFRNVNDLIKDWMLDIHCLDWVIGYELSKKGRIKYLNFPSGVYRIHDGGIYSSIDNEIKNKINIQAQEAIGNDYELHIIKKNERNE